MTVITASYGGLTNSSVLFIFVANVVSNGRLTVSSVWYKSKMLSHADELVISYNKTTVCQGILLLSHTNDLISHLYEITTIHIYYTEET